MEDLWASSDMYSDEKEYFYETKSEEEINKYTLSEDLSTIQRTKEILSFGDVVQKIAIYKSLPVLIQESGVEERLMTMVAKQLESQEAQVKVEAGRSFLRMIEEKKTESFKSIEFLKDILQLTMNLLHNQNIQVVDIWIDVFQKLLAEIPFAEVQKDVIAEIYDLSGICSSATSKYSSIRMIASSIQYLGKNITENLLNLIKLFCQFNDFQIKKSIVSEICPKLFSFLKQSQLDYEWLPLVTDIIKSNNENKEIRCLAITTLAQTLSCFSSETKSDKIIPILNYLVSFDSDIEVVIGISKQFGPLIFNLENELTQKESNLSSLISYIYESLESKNEDIRLNTMYNFPCILSIFGKKCKDKLMKLYINVLTKDVENKVRLQAIKILPEIVKFLGFEETKTLLKQHIKSIFGEKDNNDLRTELAKKLPYILEFLYQNEKETQLNLQKQQNKDNNNSNTNNTNHPLSAPIQGYNILQIFSPNGSNKSTGALMIQELFSEIMNCIEQNTKSPCWRLVKSLLEIFQQTGNTFNFSVIQEKYASILFKCILESNFELKKLAAKNLVHLIVQQKQAPMREYLFAQINSKLYSGKSYHLRMVYLEVVEECIFKFTRSFFKQYNLIQSLQLYNDKVPNVRRKLASMIVKIRNCIFKEDTEQIESFDSLIIHLVLDNDSETARIAQQQHSNLRDIDSFQSTQDEQDVDKIQDLQDFIEENDYETSALTNPSKKYRSFDASDKNPYSTPSIQSSLIPGCNLIKRKNINVKKIPSLGNTKSLSTPKNSSLTSISSSKGNASSNLSNTTTSTSTSTSTSLVIKQSNEQKKNRRNSSNSNNTVPTAPNEKPPTAHSLLVQKPMTSLTQISGQQSQGSLLKQKQNLSPIISSNQPAIQNKGLSQHNDITYTYTSRRNPFIDQNEAYNVKERNSASLNKYNTLKPLQKNQSKITPFNMSVTPQSNILNQSIQSALNISNNVQNDKKYSFERKSTFENSPNNPLSASTVCSGSTNIYRIKKQIPLQTSGLPPKFSIKKKA